MAISKRKQIAMVGEELIVFWFYPRNFWIMVAIVILQIFGAHKFQ